MRDIQGYENLYAINEEGKIWSYPKLPRNPNGMWLIPRKTIVKR